MKLAETPPTHCSSCFGQYTERKHVDLEAAWEGPTFKEGVVGDDGEITNTIPVSIDDLIVCEDCLRAAAALLGLKDPDEVSAYAEDLEKRNDELLERNRGLADYVKTLEAAAAARDELTTA